MKIVSVTEVDLPVADVFRTELKYYHVRLGNGVNKRFSQHRDAAAFAVATNQFLTETLAHTNDLYIEAFTIYRQSWYYFTGRNDKNADKATVAESTIRKNLNDIDHCFVQCERNVKGHPNHPWRMIVLAADALLNVFTTMLKFGQTKLRWHEKNRLENLCKKTIELVQMLAAWGKDFDFTYEPINQVTLWLQKVKKYEFL
jgi:hypothetical protein